MYASKCEIAELLCPFRTVSWVKLLEAESYGQTTEQTDRQTDSTNIAGYCCCG